MLVQALTEYANNYLSEQLNDAAWETKPVQWQVNISHQGKFLNVTERTTTQTRGKKQRPAPIAMSVPRSPVNRNSGEHPLLGTDDIAYVLGVGPWTGDKPADNERAQKHHAAFVSLVDRAAAETGDAALACCIQFYANPEEVEKARGALGEARAGALVALAMDGPIVEREAVRQYWRNHYSNAFAARVEGSEGECMVSGKLGLIAPTHEKIKGLSSLGGQASGVALMSFDKESFRSYGWEQNLNSPISPDRALAYVLALNDLLKQEKGRRRDIARIGFLYWLKNPSDTDIVDLLDHADPDQVESLLSYDPRSDPDANRFYMMAVSGNGARLRVRQWADLAFPQVKANLQDWHRQLRVEYPLSGGAEAPPVRLWQVLNALDRDGSPDDHTVLALLRRGIEGTPLGYAVLSKALRMLRHPGAENNKGKADRRSEPMGLARLRVPVGLIRMCINDLLRQRKGVREMSEGLDINCTLSAYVCGRLMAEFENLQRASSENEVNSSVLDRYFALASTYPAVAFPKIETLAQKHMRKLRRDNPPAAYAIDLRLQDLHRLLSPREGGAYPGRLSLEGQGLFALGYYHQKARSRAEAAASKQAKDAVNEFETEINQKGNKG